MTDLERARQAAAQVWKQQNENAAVQLLILGQCDHYREVQSALLAIQRRDAEIVAWLREYANEVGGLHSSAGSFIRGAADAIERESGNG